MTDDTFSPTQHTLFDVLDDLVRRCPNRHFLSASSDSSLSYHAVYRLATELLPRRFINVFPSFKTTPCPRVALISPNTPLVPLTLWALWAISGTAIQLSPTADPGLWSEMLRVSRPHFILVARHLLDKLDLHEVTVPVVVIESLLPTLGDLTPISAQVMIKVCQDWLLRTSEENPPPLHLNSRPTPSTSATLLFTSSPIDSATVKCVTYTHAALLAASWRSVEGLGGAIYTQKPKRHLGWLPLSHCYELAFSYLGIVLRTGGDYIFYDPLVSCPDMPFTTPFPQLLLTSLEFHHPIDSLCIVPAILSVIYQDVTASQLNALQSLSSLCAGGAPSSEEVSNWAIINKIKYADMMGATEMVGLLATRKIWLGENDFESAPGLSAVLRKEKESDTYGELILMGQHLPHGYESIDSSAFQYDTSSGVAVYHTRDMYSQGPDFAGTVVISSRPLPPNLGPTAPMKGIRYLGRYDDVLVLDSGIKVDLLLTEKTLDSQPEIRRSAVILDQKRSALIALVEPESQVSFDRVASAIAHVNRDLSYETRIRRDNIVLVDVLPVTPKFTLHRKKLQAIIDGAGGVWPPSRVRGHGTINQSDMSIPSDARDGDAIPNTVRRKMQSLVADVLNIDILDTLDSDFSLADLVITSLASVVLANRIKEEFHHPFNLVQLRSCRSVADLCRLVVGAQPKLTLGRGHEPQQTPAEISPPEALVISGVSCRFPGSITSIDELWATLTSPELYTSNLARPADPSRWDPDLTNAKLPMAWLGDEVVNDASSVASFFKIPLPEVEAMSPNARLVLQMGYSAVEDAGIAPKSLGGKVWGVFTSLSNSGWSERQVKILSTEDYSRYMTSIPDEGAGARLAYHLNLLGPTMEIKSACSSSTVALHQACASICNGDCDAAIVIAATTHFSPAGSIFREKAGIASPNGRCATFSSDADGFLPSEGTIAVVVQREGDARCPDYARIRATAVAQDGRGFNFLSPNADAQVRLLEAALDKARCAPDDISYIEAHGTGTRVGDSIEIAALNRVYGEARTRPLPVGAVKAVLGHSEECAGLTGILKAIKCFEHDAIPPQPHLASINADCRLDGSKIFFPRSIYPFAKAKPDRPRLIGASSFGLYGTIAHTILEAPPLPLLPPPLPASGNDSDGRVIYLISAISEPDFRASLRQHRQFIQSPQRQKASLADAGRTTQIGRDHFPYRKAFAASSWGELLAGITALEGSREWECKRAPRNPQIALWFSLPHPGAEVALGGFERHPVFIDGMRKCMDNGCTLACVPFARQLSVAWTLQALGCRVSAVGGEGVGEYVAACFAGVFDATTLFSLLGALSPNPDLAACIVKCEPKALQDLLLTFRPSELRMAGEDAGGLACLVGSRGAVAELAEELGADSVMEAHPFARCSTVPRGAVADAGPSTIALVSSSLGQVVDASVLASGDYWAALPGRFGRAGDAVAALGERGDLVLRLDVVRGGFAVGLGGIGGCGRGSLSLGAFGGDGDELMCCLYEAGCALDWGGWTAGGRTVHLPAYPFHRAAVV